MKLIDGGTSRARWPADGARSVHLTRLQVYGLDEAQYQRLKTGDRLRVNPRGKIEELFQGN